MFALKPPGEVRVKEGSPLDIPCEGFGDPVPIVYWLHNQVKRKQAFSKILRLD